MDITKLKRDAKTVHNALKKQSDGSWICLAECKIYIPVRYVTRGLATIGVETRIAGIYGIVVGNSFGVSLVHAMFDTEPSSINTVIIDSEDYYELGYSRGDTIVSNNMVIQDDNFVYEAYRELIATGHVPWFINYTDDGKVLSGAKKFGGAGLGNANRATFEVIASTLARSSKDPTQQRRYSILKQEDVYTTDVRYVPLNSVIYGASNTTAKLMGAYLEQGMSSALAHPSNVNEDMEELWR